MKHIITPLLLLATTICLHAQDFTDVSEKVSGITGVWVSETRTIETPNVISSSTNASYVMEHQYEYSNIVEMGTERITLNGRQWFILETKYKMDTHDGGCTEMLRLMALTEAQRTKMRNLSSEPVELTYIPAYCTWAPSMFFDKQGVVDGLRNAIASKADIMSITYAMTAKKEEDTVIFSIDVDCWTWTGTISNRTYEPQSLTDNLDGGYFRVSNEDWRKLW